MKRHIFACSVFAACIFVSSVGYSQVPSRARIAQAKAKCDSMHPGNIALKAVCHQSVDMYVLRKRLEASNKHRKIALKGALQKLEKKREAGMKSLATLLRQSMADMRATVRNANSSAMRKLGSKMKARRIPQKVVSRPRLVRPSMGVQFPVVMPAPGSYAAATFPAGMRFYVQIAMLRQGARNWFRQHIPFRVVVIKNGLPLAVSHPGGTFQEFYADLDGDGQPEPHPYKGVNPGLSDELYVAHRPCRPNRLCETIDIIFLRETGDYVRVPGIPPQPLWGDSVRVRVRKFAHAGRWRVMAFDGIGERHND